MKKEVPCPGCCACAPDRPRICGGSKAFSFGPDRCQCGIRCDGSGKLTGVYLRNYKPPRSEEGDLYCD